MSPADPVRANRVYAILPAIIRRADPLEPPAVTALKAALIVAAVDEVLARPLEEILELLHGQDDPKPGQRRKDAPTDADLDARAAKMDVAPRKRGGRRKRANAEAATAGAIPTMAVHGTSVEGAGA
jgi:hypothetical protein